MLHHVCFSLQAYETLCRTFCQDTVSSFPLMLSIGPIHAPLEFRSRQTLYDWYAPKDRIQVWNGLEWFRAVKIPSNHRGCPDLVFPTGTCRCMRPAALCLFQSRFGNLCRRRFSGWASRPNANMRSGLRRTAVQQARILRAPSQYCGKSRVRREMGRASIGKCPAALHQPWGCCIGWNRRI